MTTSLEGTAKGGTAVQIGRAAEEVRWESLPAEVRERAMRIIADTLAVARAGSKDEFCAAYIARTAEPAVGGPASVITGGYRIAAELAAHLNALPTTVHQMDEGHLRARGHPGLHVVPVALAVAEELDASGAAMVEAVAAGYETAVAVSAAVGWLHSDLHPHGAWATFGAAVAAAKLFGADRVELEDVIEAVAAVPLSPWRGTVATGRTVHHLYAALAAQTAVSQARAVMSGATAQSGALDDYYIPAFRGQATTWTPGEHEILNNYFKFYPACAHAFTSIQAIERLRDRWAFNAGDLERIDIYGYHAVLGLAEQRPASNLAARFSLPFLIGQTLVNGKISMNIVDNAELEDPSVRGIAERVNLHLDPELDAIFPASRPVRVVLTLRDGTRHECEETVPRGEGERREPDAVWRQKINELLGDEGMSRGLLDLVEAEPEEWTARELGAVFRH